MDSDQQTGTPPTPEQRKAMMAQIMKKLKTYIPYRELAKGHNWDFEGPIIGWCPSWRYGHDFEKEDEYLINPETGEKELGYSSLIIDNYVEMVEKAGGHLVFLRFDDKAEDFIGKIDGLIMPGGKDLDPQFYGEENTHSNLDPFNCQLRIDNMVDWFDNSDKNMPILGVCLGSQFLNCHLGGKLNQHLDNAKEHLFKIREVNIVEGTHLHKAVGGKSKMYGGCSHHQGIINVPDCLVVNSTDTLDGTPHGLECKDRPVFSTLWHPEISCAMIGGKDDEGANQDVINYLAKLASKYKAMKKATEYKPKL